MEWEAVVRLLDACDAIGVSPWLDGGWGVDALLGRQTRVHQDVDVVIDRIMLTRVDGLLRDGDFSVIRDWLPVSIAYRHHDGREVDLHPVDVTADGGGDQVFADGTRWHYGPPVVGSIGARPVRCCSAQEQLQMHQGYELREVDLADCAALAEAFGLELPPALRRAPR